MTKRVRKIATYCLIGSLAFMGGSKTSYASELPITGISILLNDISENPDFTNKELDYILNPNKEYQDLAIANVANYVHIRSEANTDSKVVGKLYSNGAATILESNGDWTKVRSGDVTGYIKSDYLHTGLDAYELVDKVKTKQATVKANALNVRAKVGTSSSVVGLVPKGYNLQVLEEKEDWIRVSVGDKTGYVSSDYVDISTDFKKAISIEQEQKRMEIEKKRQDTKANKTVSSLRQQIVNYALRFNGNPYVWGGTSLTRGADCSGFTQSVMKKFGIHIPRTSREQARAGKRVSLDKMQAGDLIFYRKNGVVNHVAMYIGNGKVIGAASRKEGIKIKKYNYRTPYRVVSYINR